MSKPKYKTVTRTQGNNLALKDGTVKPETFDFDFEEVPVLVHGFRRMVRELEFDISEMALTTYICAKEHGVDFTALPIFLVRSFHHGAILCNTKTGIDKPKDLEGKKVGVNRGYTVTTGVWARGILQDEYGVDLSKITWVLSGDEHVTDYQYPPNVVGINEGETIPDLLASGELAAAIGIDLVHPDVEKLIPDAQEAGMQALLQRGLYPINHLIVVRNEVLRANSGLATDIFNTFSESKQLYLERLRTGEIDKLSPVDIMHLRVMELMPDPLPYGIEPNRRVLEQLVGHAETQNIITRQVSLDELFDPGTLGLTG